MNNWNQLREEILQNLLHTGKKKVDEDTYDPCPVCETDLYYNEKYTNRCAIIDEKDNISGWLCPFCKTEFDSDNRVIILLSEEEVRGES